MSVTIDLTRALRKLRALNIERALTAALDAGATAAHDVLATYPPQQRGRRNPAHTRRQRAYLAILAQQGKLPYRRTGNLRQKLAIIKPSRDTRTVVNTASYWRYVWGEPQAPVHVGVWPTVGDARAAAEREARAVLRQIIEKGGV